MKYSLTMVSLAAAAALLLSACNAPETPMPTSMPAPLPTAPDPSFQSPVQPGDAPEAASPERAAAGVAIQDLAGRLGVAPETIAVVEVTEVEWPDASLGCPAPDMGYAQMITPGVQVILESGGQTYEYHGRSLEDLFLCGPEGPVAPAQ